MEWFNKGCRPIVPHVTYRKFNPQNFEVLVAHGKASSAKPEVGQIVCWYGTKFGRDTRLSFPDIAVISRETGRTVLLAEIEEGQARPKQVLADALATIIAGHVSFRHGSSAPRDLLVGEWTKMLILVPGRIKSPRLEFVEKKLNEIKERLQTSNARIRTITIDTFADQRKLERRLAQEIQ